MEDQDEGSEYILDKQKPFKLCFTEKIPLGRSNIRIERPLRVPPILTTKFYIGRQEHFDDEQVEVNLKKLVVHGPREKYHYPLTEGQTYGWYHDYKLSKVDRNDLRFNFPKRTDPLIYEHLMNYAKIR